MKIVVNSQVLAQELRTVCKIAPTRSPVPILNHVVMEAESSTLRFIATDLEIGIRSECVASVLAPGRVALPAHKLLAIVEQFPNADVTLTLSGSQVIVTCLAFSSRIQIPNVEDFPLLPPVEGQHVSLPAEDFHRVIGHVRHTVGDGSNKYIPQGALLSLTGSVGALVGTDGKRLSISTMAYSGAPLQVILPVKILEALSEQETDVFEMHVGERHIFFQCGPRMLISRMLEGQFPAYQRSIPQDCDKKAVVNRVEFQAALKRVGLLSDECAVNFSFSSGALDLQAASMKIGDAVERIRITYTGDPIAVRANWTHFLEFLDVASQADVTLQMKNADSPVLLADGPDHLAMILVMRS